MSDVVVVRLVRSLWMHGKIEIPAGAVLTGTIKRRRKFSMRWLYPSGGGRFTGMPVTFPGGFTMIPEFYDRPITSSPGEGTSRWWVELSPLERLAVALDEGTKHG